MKFLLAAVNAKYIHSNPGVYSLKRYAEEEKRSREEQRESKEQGDRGPREPGLPAAYEQQAGYETKPGYEPKAIYKKSMEEEMEIQIAEYTINHQMDQILEDLYRRQPEAVGFSCYIWNIEYVRELVHDLHKVLPDTDIWLGGPEVSYDALRLLEREPKVLGVMKGEGEATFAGLLECYRMLGGSVRKTLREGGERERLSAHQGKEAYPAACKGRAEETCQKAGRGLREFWENLGQLEGIAFRDGAGRIRERESGQTENLSRIPFLYQDLEGLEHRIVYYESSRGCPFSCSYCLSSLDKSVRFRDLKLVRKELDFFLEQKVPQVKFVDRTFNCKKDHAMAIWQHILEHDNGVTNFHFEISADLLEEEELELIGRMRPGLIQLEIGVQSTNPDTIREIHRRMDLGKLRQAVARINQGHNVHQHLDLIAGLPFEGYESFRRSFNEVYEMEPEQLQLGFLKVLKGSYMQDMAEKYELVYREKPPYEVLSTRWLTYGEICRLKGIEAMVEVYYNSSQFTNTLRLLEKEFSGAFDLYEELARYYEEKGLKGRSHSRMARYEILHDFIRDLLVKGQKEVRTDMHLVGVEESMEGFRGIFAEKWERFQDCLVYDCYLRENCKSRPGFALDLAPYKDLLRRLAPWQKSLGAQVHVEVFRSGEVWVFDYRSRDPLTRNAFVTRLQERKKGMGKE